MERPLSVTLASTNQTSVHAPEFSVICLAFDADNGDYNFNVNVFAAAGSLLPTANIIASIPICQEAQLILAGVSLKTFTLTVRRNLLKAVNASSSHDPERIESFFFVFIYIQVRYFQLARMDSG